MSDYKSRKLDSFEKSDVRLLENICRNSGSVSVRRQSACISMEVFRANRDASKLWVEILNEKAFYLCRRRKDGVRLVEFVVSEECQGNGLGKALFERLIERVKNEGFDHITFRANQNEIALQFWQHLGAKIVDVNGDDFEMLYLIKG